MTEAMARIKINQMHEKTGWRFFGSPEGHANILLEGKEMIKKPGLDALGENFEKTKSGYMDFLLLDEKNFPSSLGKQNGKNNPTWTARSRVFKI